MVAGDALTECEIVIFPGVRIERQAPVFVDDMSPPESDGGVKHGSSRPRRSS